MTTQHSLKYNSIDKYLAMVNSETLVQAQCNFTSFTLKFGSWTFSLAVKGKVVPVLNYAPPHKDI